MSFACTMLFQGRSYIGQTAGVKIAHFFGIFFAVYSMCGKNFMNSQMSNFLSIDELIYILIYIHKWYWFYIYAYFRFVVSRADTQFLYAFIGAYTTVIEAYWDHFWYHTPVSMGSFRFALHTLTRYACKASKVYACLHQCGCVCMLFVFQSEDRKVS